MPPINLLALCGSLRQGSLNSAVAHTAASLCRPPVAMTVYEGLGGLPFFNPDVERECPPAEVLDFRARLAAADAVLITSPEYAHGTSGVLKNGLEWVVGSGELVDKPVAVVTASPSMTGGARAQAWLRETLQVMSARVLPHELRIPCATVKITNGRVTDEETLTGLRSVLADLTRETSQLGEPVPSGA
ncbi:NADPH-dependent FMN reductase [Streptomyces sp. NPDC026206]|uniref:NADPH-dependent FMN reductase n=1 Tax=Streptomyces sp. NPDC026206 TaxID=3157089 RepID=UPI0033ED418C